MPSRRSPTTRKHLYQTVANKENFLITLRMQNAVHKDCSFLATLSSPSDALVCMTCDLELQSRVRDGHDTIFSIVFKNNKTINYDELDDVGKCLNCYLPQNDGVFSLLIA